MSRFGFQAPAGRGDGSYKPGIGEILDRVFGIGVTDAIDQARARHAAQQMAPQQQALEEQVLIDPRERLAYGANRGKWGESVSGNYAPQKVGGGDTLMRPGYGSTTAPRYEMSGDSGVELGPDGMKVLGQRPPSQSEETNEAYKQAQILMQQLLAKSLIGHRANQDGTASFRAHKAPAGGGGGGRGGLPPPPSGWR